MESNLTKRMVVGGENLNVSVPTQVPSDPEERGMFQYHSTMQAYQTLIGTFLGSTVGSLASKGSLKYAALGATLGGIAGYTFKRWFPMPRT